MTKLVRWIFLFVLISSFTIGCLYRSMNLPVLANGAKSFPIKAKTRLSVLLKGEYCAEICKSDESSRKCNREGDCKRSLLGWYPVESFRDERNYSFRQFYPRRKWNLLRNIPDAVSGLCEENKNWSCHGGRIGNEKNATDRYIEIRINGFEREIHWSLYAASFSLLLFPGYFSETVNLDIDYSIDGKLYSVNFSEKPNWSYWFGWIFFPWGSFASAPDEKLFLGILETLSKTFAKNDI